MHVGGVASGAFWHTEIRGGFNAIADTNSEWQLRASDFSRRSEFLSLGGGRVGKLSMERSLSQGCYQFMGHVFVFKMRLVQREAYVGTSSVYYKKVCPGGHPHN